MMMISSSLTMGLSKMQAACPRTSKGTTTKFFRCLKKVFSHKRWKKLQCVQETEDPFNKPLVFERDLMDQREEVERLKTQLDGPLIHRDFLESKAFECREVVHVPAAYQKSPVHPFQKNYTGLSDKSPDNITAKLEVALSIIGQSTTSTYSEKKGLEDVLIRVMQVEVTLQFAVTEFQLSGTCRFFLNGTLFETVCMMYLFPSSQYYMDLPQVDRSPDNPSISQSITTEEPFQKQARTVRGVGSSSDASHPLKVQDEEHRSLLLSNESGAAHVSLAEKVPGEMSSSFDGQSSLPQPVNECGAVSLAEKVAAEISSSFDNQSSLPQPVNESGAVSLAEKVAAEISSSFDNQSSLPQPVNESGAVNLAEKVAAEISSSFDNQSSLPQPVNESGAEYVSQSILPIINKKEGKKMRRMKKRRRGNKKKSSRGYKRRMKKAQIKVVEKKPDAEASRARREVKLPIPHIVQAPGGSSDKKTRQSGGDKNGQERSTKQTSTNVSTSSSSGRNSGRTGGACGGAGGDEPPDDGNRKKAVPPDIKQGTDDEDGEEDEEDEDEDGNGNEEKRQRGNPLMEERQTTNIPWTDDNKVHLRDFLRDGQGSDGQPFRHSGYTLQADANNRTSGDQPVSSSRLLQSESFAGGNRAPGNQPLSLPSQSKTKSCQEGDASSCQDGYQRDSPSYPPLIITTRFGSYIDTPRSASSFPPPRNEPPLHYLSGGPIFEEASSLLPNPRSTRSPASESERPHSEGDETSSQPEPLQGSDERASGDTSVQTVELPVGQGDQMSPSGRSGGPVQHVESSGQGSGLSASDREYNSYSRANLMRAASLERDPQKKFELYQDVAKIEEDTQGDNCGNRGGD